MQACLLTYRIVVCSMSPFIQCRTLVISGTAHSGLGLPTLINLRQSLKDMPTGQPNVDDPSLGLPWVTLDYVMQINQPSTKVSKTQPHRHFRLHSSLSGTCPVHLQGGWKHLGPLSTKYKLPHPPLRIHTHTIVIIKRKKICRHFQKSPKRQN